MPLAAAVLRPRTSEKGAVMARRKQVITIIGAGIGHTVLDGGGFERALETPDLANAAIEAGNASLRMDEFTIPSCGFKFSN